MEQTYYLHHTATKETSSFGPVGKFSELVEVTHGPPASRPSASRPAPKIVDVDEARRIWGLLVDAGFNRHINKKP